MRYLHKINSTAFRFILFITFSTFDMNCVLYSGISMFLCKKCLKVILEGNQWENTASILGWFSNLKNIEGLSVIYFHCSFSKSLFTRFIQFAKQMTKTSDEDMNLIMQAKKNLFAEDILWVKMEGKRNFDVPIGYFDGLEACELVESYILK